MTGVLARNCYRDIGWNLAVCIGPSLLDALAGSWDWPMDRAQSLAASGGGERWAPKKTAPTPPRRAAPIEVSGVAYFAAAYNAPTLFQSITFQTALR